MNSWRAVILIPTGFSRISRILIDGNGQDNGTGRMERMENGGEMYLGDSSNSHSEKEPLGVR